MEIGDIYLVNFHYEENTGMAKLRPAVCILVNSDNNEFAGLKVTSKERTYDRYSIRLAESQAAGLNFQSFVRCNKIEFFKQSEVIAKLGNLTDRDLRSVIIGFNNYYSRLSEINRSIIQYQAEPEQPDLEME
ncbi:type II toxin-antitoxin system PemK/MazF family toxin [Ruminococcus sp. Marseille-P6503]|uniref:type II toxin-antitoxin system PemK/MazF family toxin n=1 Tax=Ruminococcus sp. Marseille-P6503 TaxID=2364796 RepID=UPI000F52DB81|nr:type II toxin-antitoxin system PemK/MazF family toxin [Ruminococcus sp. Marseille-P6503]